jgi:hypothetical protein
MSPEKSPMSSPKKRDVVRAEIKPKPIVIVKEESKAETES